MPRVANGVGVGCKRALASARAAAVAALVELMDGTGAIMRVKLDSFGNTFGAGPRNVDAVTSVVVRVGSEIPTVNTVGGGRCDDRLVLRRQRCGCRGVIRVCSCSRRH